MCDTKEEFEEWMDSPDGEAFCQAWMNYYLSMMTRRSDASVYDLWKTDEVQMKQLVIIDTETGGLDPAKHSILSLGAALWQDGKVVSTYYTLINEPDRSVTDDALRVNGITHEMIDSGLSPIDAVENLRQWLTMNSVFGRVMIGGHNIAGFDMGFLKRLYLLGCTRMPFEYHVIDTMSIALALKFAGKLDVKNVKLDTLCEHYGIQIRDGGTSGTHNAKEDAVATAHLLTKLLADISPNVAETDTA